MVSEIVELTVVGIRNYCPGEEDGLPELFDRLPVGKILFMKINPSGSKFPGSVSVYDGIGNIIGSISKTDRRFIELAIPQDGMLPCKVVGHSLEHNCMYVEAENKVGFKEPYIRQTSAEKGELIFGITEEDNRLKTLTHLIQTQLSLPVHDCQELVEVANEYAMICCTSLDGETSFARADILRQLKKVNNGSGVLDNAINKIFEDTKDLGRKYNDVKTTVYRNQYNRIFASAHEKKDGKPSELETYIKSLAFRNGNILTQEVIKEEVDKLSMQLANDFMGTYVKASETDEDFATALYSLNYSLHAIYVMYTRRIKREYLLRMLEKPLTVDDVQMPNPTTAEKPRGPRKKFLFTQDGIDTKENEVMKQSEKERLCSYLSRHCLKSRKLVCTKEDTLNKTIVCFLLKWMEKGLTAEEPSGGAVFRFLTEDCCIVSEVQEKAYANRVKEWIKDKFGYDTEVMLMVKDAFE